jgi:uncharacterized integral membrane protein
MSVTSRPTGTGPFESVPQSAQDQPEIPSIAPAVTDQPLAPHPIRRTRIGGIWVAAVAFALILLLLMIFILENGQSVSVGYFGAHGHLPLGVALLLAAVFGVLLVVIPGTGRIIQLRITAYRHRRADLAPSVLTDSTHGQGQQ